MDYVELADLLLPEVNMSIDKIMGISKENMRYACETAEAVGTNIDYIVGDVIYIEFNGFTAE